MMLLFWAEEDDEDSGSGSCFEGCPRRGQSAKSFVPLQLALLMSSRALVILLYKYDLLRMAQV